MVAGDRRLAAQSSSNTDSIKSLLKTVDRARSSPSPNLPATSAGAAAKQQREPGVSDRPSARANAQTSGQERRRETAPSRSIRKPPRGRVALRHISLVVDSAIAFWGPSGDTCSLRFGWRKYAVLTGFWLRSVTVACTATALVAVGCGGAAEKTASSAPPTTSAPPAPSPTAPPAPSPTATTPPAPSTSTSPAPPSAPEYAGLS